MSDMDVNGELSDVEGEDGAGAVTIRKLTKDDIPEGLSLLWRIGKGLGYAFVRLDLSNNSLSDVSVISSYIHIRFLDLTNNDLTDLSPLAALDHLLWLKVDKNAVASFKGQPFAEFPFLQWLSIATNRLADLDGLVGPAALESFNLSGNSIQQLNGFQSDNFSNLVTLELRGNKLETTEGINLPNLRKLYLAQNVITHLEGLEKLERLTVLHLRDNQLKSLDGLSPCMKSLQYLNVRDNLMSDAEALQSLCHVSQTLRVLVLTGNLLAGTPDYHLEVLKLLPHLQRLDKDPVTPEERNQAQEKIRELQD